MQNYIRRFIIAFIIISIAYADKIEERYKGTSLRIISKALSDSTAYNRLSYLCDMFSYRLSGSKGLEDAINWIIKEMKKDGLDNVQGQRVKVPTWIRGEESVSILKPFNKQLNMLGIGGSVGTSKSGIVGDLVVVESFDELEEISKDINGKIVLFNVPFTSYGETVSYRYSGASRAAKYGAKATLIRSIGSWSMDTPHTGTMFYDRNIRKIPHAAITMEDAMSLGRIYNRGDKITVKVKMDAKTVPDRWSRNVISQINGSIYPDQIIVIGGHIDSWDVGQGAHDDAGGCLVAWEAIRLIKELELTPKRTIRCVLWTNEENGGKGNKAYRDMYLDEIGNHILAIESDGGVFAPEGFGFTGSNEAKAIVESIHKLLKPIKANFMSEGGRAADIAPLNDKGVPVMSLKVDNSKYFWFHHTNADTFDKVDFYEFNKCVAAMAIMAYTVADLDNPLPR